MAGTGIGGGLDINGGSFTMVGGRVLDNQAIGGAGGNGGCGGDSDDNDGGQGGQGGQGGGALAGGLEFFQTTANLYGVTLSANSAQAGPGGTGGLGGASDDGWGGAGSDGGPGVNAFGGAIVADDSSLGLFHCQVANNHVTGGAGGAAGAANTGNLANPGGQGGPSGVAFGGGLFANNSKVTCDYDVFLADTATGGTGGAGGDGGVATADTVGGPGGDGTAGGLAAGGGIAVSRQSTLTLTNSTIDQCSATGGTGGPSGAGNLSDDEGGAGGIAGNGGDAEGGGLFAGAVFDDMNNITIRIDHSTLSNNTVTGGVGGAGKPGGPASDGSGGVGGSGGDGGQAQGAGLDAEAGATITIVNSTLSTNTATGGQGGAAGQGGPGNNAGAPGFAGTNGTAIGGGFHVGAASLQQGSDPAASLVLDNVTIVLNVASSGGGGQNDSGSVTAFNTLIAKNTAAKAPDFMGVFVAGSGNNLLGIGDGAILLGPHNLIGTSLKPLDPKIGPLANNGGPTKTHRLLAGSPAINAGDDNHKPPGSTDQRGQARIFGPHIDIGAVEYQGKADDGRSTTVPPSPRHGKAPGPVGMGSTLVFPELILPPHLDDLAVAARPRAWRTALDILFAANSRSTRS
jgi:hypothetical protein